MTGQRDIKFSEGISSDDVFVCVCVGGVGVQAVKVILTDSTWKHIRNSESAVVCTQPKHDAVEMHF